MFWRSDFAEVIKRTFPDWFELFYKGQEPPSETPRMRFLKLDENGLSYEIEFINPGEIELDIESEISEEQTRRAEGAIKHYYGKRYERDPNNRRKAIEIHGYSCVVCGFRFEDYYGERGRGFIEIHHARPLSSTDEAIFVSPETDLVPVCSNCHRIIHRRKDDVLGVDKAKRIIKRAKTQNRTHPL